MTFLLGWQDDDGVFLCADSAVPREGAPRGSMSSFGEAQQVDRFAVEERAVKLLELPRSVLVAICGDAASALDFVMSMRTQLAYTDKPLVDILRDQGTADDLRYGFELLIGHHVDGLPALTAFQSRDRNIEEVGAHRFATFGSMPPEKKDLAGRLATVVRSHGLSPEPRLAATLVALQAIGITEYLPQHGVGGAFFGARVTRERIIWQPDLCYVTYPPGMFRAARFVEGGDTKTIIPSANAVENIRVLVRDGAGILLSSLGEPRGRVLIPPTSGRAEAEWQEIVLAAVPPPFRLLVPSQHFGLLSVRYSKGVYIYNPSLGEGSLSITDRHGQVAIGAIPRLVETLELATPAGRFDLTIIVEDETGTDGKTYGVALPT